ncbi:SDR family NAD(P)-dependent oxidoreductase [Peribacillus butanolivorans]|uniref:SDR family NAD(P)-dependent oxidoreductase n=1 Tax=Peribacillus butanolivorans TaxID=421767 RepID=UPI0006A708D3|nr:SDR family NAD(P)-dependent oxidoreductase [Peribacillus butanolivorans]
MFQSIKKLETLPLQECQSYKNKKGRIINISSAHGKNPDAYKSAHCAAKFGQGGFTKVTALENALNGITCNTIMPGLVRTELIEKQLPVRVEQDGTTVEEALNHHILAELGIKLLEPSEIDCTAVCIVTVQQPSLVKK